MQPALYKINSLTKELEVPIVTDFLKTTSDQPYCKSPVTSLQRIGY